MSVEFINCTDWSMCVMTADKCSCYARDMQRVLMTRARSFTLKISPNSAGWFAQIYGLPQPSITGLTVRYSFIETIKSTANYQCMQT